jgi:hypothetical protein
MFTVLILYRVIQKSINFKNFILQKTTDAKSVFCVRMERKALKVLISMI